MLVTINLKIMKKLFAIIILATLASCAVANPPTGSGFFYTDVRELVYFDPYIKPSQKATLCSKNTLGLMATGDSGLDALRARSSIRKISSIERTYTSRFFIFAESCLVVVGE